MASAPSPLPEPSLADLVGRAVEDGKAFAAAEIALLKAVAAERGRAVVTPAILFVVALYLLSAAVTVLLAALGLALAIWLGPAGGLAIAGVIGLVLVGLLGWIGARKLGGVARPLPDLTGARP